MRSPPRRFLSLWKPRVRRSVGGGSNRITHLCRLPRGWWWWWWLPFWSSNPVNRISSSRPDEINFRDSVTLALPAFLSPPRPAHSPILPNDHSTPSLIRSQMGVFLPCDTSIGHIRFKRVCPSRALIRCFKNNYSAKYIFGPFCMSLHRPGRCCCGHTL